MDKKLLAQELERDERRVKTVYLDSRGIATVGVGRNLRDRGLSDDEIDYLLGNDITAVEQDLDRNLPWWRNLSEVRQRVLANMCFNLGINRLLGFKKMLGAVCGGDYHEAAAQMLNSTWATQVGNRAIRLATMMKEG